MRFITRAEVKSKGKRRRVATIEQDCLGQVAHRVCDG